eukprot:10455312-Alexandrium_andersonii.AAC.1
MSILAAVPKDMRDRGSDGKPTVRAGRANGASMLGPSGGPLAHATARDHACMLVDAAEDRP